MNQVSREWLDFLRQQYPKGSRIKLREMKDPYAPVEPGSMGTLVAIDDLGTFHVKWDNGRALGVVIGEDSFTVLPPEAQTVKFFFPLTADLFERNEWGDLEEESTLMDGRDLREYEGTILKALRDNAMPEEAESGLMHWYDKDDTVKERVKSVVFTVEGRNRRLWGVAECKVVGELTASEKNALLDFISGQASDGWGEGFEQRDIKIGDCVMNVHLWNSDNWSIVAEQDRFDPEFSHRLPDMCWSITEAEGRLICIQKGKPGYALSEWDTGDPARNCRIADYNNQRLGVTSEQKAAMVHGSLFGWDTPGADPKAYEKHGGPTEAQRSGFGGERSSSEMSEPCPQDEAKNMELGTTMGGMTFG